MYIVKKVVEGEKSIYLRMYPEGTHIGNSSDMTIGGGFSPRFIAASQIALEILSLSSVRYPRNAPSLHSNAKH